MKRTFLRFSLIVAVAFFGFILIAFTKSNKDPLRENCSAFQKQSGKTEAPGDFIIWESLATSLLATTQ
jgi:hypothetical protein